MTSYLQAKMKAKIQKSVRMNAKEAMLLAEFAELLEVSENEAFKILIRGLPRKINKLKRERKKLSNN